MRARGFKGEGTPLGFGEWLECGRFRARLYPAGHILGSAMIFIESGWGTFLYTGDYRTPPSPASDGFDAPEHADILITEATFSLPVYRWKPHHELAEMVRRFALDSLEEGFTPIFLGCSLGKTQEVMHLLKPLNVPVRVHGSALKLCDLYTEYGISLGQYSGYDRTAGKDEILIPPASARSAGFASHLEPTRIAYCSGWAASKYRSIQLGADALSPLSYHLDVLDLLVFYKPPSLQPDYIIHSP